MKPEPQKIFIQDFSYELPQERIAAFPLPRRDESKLLFYNQGSIEDHVFYQLPVLLTKKSTLVFNNTRVIAARIFFQKPTGGVIELFCLEPHGAPIETALQQKGLTQWNCLIGGASKWKTGQVLTKEISIEGQPVMVEASYRGKEEDSFVIEFSWKPQQFSFSQVLQAAGAIPLPPYIKRKAAHVDEERYQTIFGVHQGSVAASTAALHFSENVLRELDEKQIKKTFLTLHVGAGTFKPVKSATIAEHHMHAEVFSVTREMIESLLDAETIVAVGTTSLRTIESLHWLGLRFLMHQNSENWELGQWEAYEMDESLSYRQTYQALLNWMNRQEIAELHCRTSLIIVPGYRFKVAKELITNFHQPQSTLLLLVAAFVGEDWRRIYRHALENNYRFLSYGDSSYLRPGAAQ